MDRDELHSNYEGNPGQWVDEELAALGPDRGWQPDTDRALLLLRRRRAAKYRTHRRWTWVAGAALATSLSLMAAPVTRAFAQRCLSACVSETSWVRQFFGAHAFGPLASNAFVEQSNRKMAPDFTLNDSAGTPVRLSDLRGKVVLLNFWATWCAPCRVEIPMFIGFQQSYRNRNFTVLGVSMDEDGWNVVRPYADAKKINYPLMIGNDKIADRFGGLKAVPTTLLIDRQGRVAATHVGLCQKNEYEGDIQRLLNE